MIKKDENFIKFINDLRLLGASAVKLELESEYLPENICFEISNVLNALNFNLILKLGGASSLNDILTAKNVCANAIVAPMIESTYGLEKFIKTLLCVYSETELLDKKIYINIETKTGIENFQAMFKSPCISYMTGIVIGRSDLSASLNISETLIDSDEMYKIIHPVIEKCYDEGKKVIIGGKITPASISFLSQFEKDRIYGFETRKVFFPAEFLQKENAANVSYAINKAIEFELYYLQNFSKKIMPDNCDIDKRILALKNRCFIEY